MNEFGQIGRQRFAVKVACDRRLEFVAVRRRKQRRRRWCGRVDDEDREPFIDCGLHNVAGTGAAVRAAAVPDRDENVDVRKDDVVRTFVGPGAFLAPSRELKQRIRP